jgi:hypothetical protein
MPVIETRRDSESKHSGHSLTSQVANFKNRLLMWFGEAQDVPRAHCRMGFRFSGIV